MVIGECLKNKHNNKKNKIISRGGKTLLLKLLANNHFDKESVSSNKHFKQIKTLTKNVTANKHFGKKIIWE